MRAGRLDRRITLQRKTFPVNSSGEAVETYVSLGTVNAEKIPLRGTTTFTAGQRVAEAENKWRIRYRTGITPMNRILDESENQHEVLAVLEIGRRAGWEIYTKGRAE